MASFSRTILLSGFAAAALTVAAGPAAADRIRNPTAVFAGLDKITGRIISFEVVIDETVQFGALQITPRVCWTRPPTEAPQTTTFTEVDEVTFNNEYRRIFTGWMYAASPGLHGVEHAIYDVWLTDCKGGTEIIVDPKDTAELPAPPADDSRRPRTPSRDVTNPQGGQPGQLPGQPGQPGQAIPPPQQPIGPGGRLDVQPPRGVPVQPRQQPNQRFFPTNPGSGRDPAGSN